LLAKYYPRNTKALYGFMETINLETLVYENPEDFIKMNFVLSKVGNPKNLLTYLQRNLTVMMEHRTPTYLEAIKSVRLLTDKFDEVVTAHVN